MDHHQQGISRRTLLRRGAAGALGLYGAGALAGVGQAASAASTHESGGVTLNWLTWSDHYFPKQIQQVQKSIGIGARPQLFSDD